MNQRNNDERVKFYATLDHRISARYTQEQNFILDYLDKHLNATIDQAQAIYKRKELKARTQERAKERKIKALMQTIE